VDIPDDLEKSLDRRLDSWVASLMSRDQQKEAQRIRELKTDVENARLPF
jgi:hypothetical protein